MIYFSYCFISINNILLVMRCYSSPVEDNNSIKFFIYLRDELNSLLPIT
jgi:hypothetical protein